MAATRSPASSFAHEDGGAVALVLAMAEGRASSERIVRDCLARIEAIDRKGPTLRSVIEINPDALAIADGARPRAQGRPAARAAARHAGPDQGQYRDRATMTDHRRDPGARRASRAARRLRRRAAARGRRGDRRQDQPLRMGEHPLDRFDLAAGARSAARCAIPMRSTAIPAARARAARVAVAGGHGAGGDRHRDRRLDHLPGGDQRHRRLQAHRRPGQPHPCRADQPQPGHGRADDAHRRATRR